MAKHKKKEKNKCRYNTKTTKYDRRRRKVYDNFQARIDRIKQKSDYTQQKLTDITTWNPID